MKQYQKIDSSDQPRAPGVPALAHAVVTRERIYEIIEKSDKNDLVGKIFDRFLLFMILSNVLAVILDSFREVSETYRAQLDAFELFSVVIFTVEYAVRLWCAPCKYPDARHPYIKYIFSFAAIIDLVAFLPFYIPFVLKIDLRIMRMLRIFRLFRIFKLNRYSHALELMGRVLRNEKDKLVMTSFIIVVMILIAASMMYYAENTVQPEKFPNIVATIWWAVATLTTVGYGDVYPVTPLGQTLGGVIAVLGIGLVALPSGIISSGLINEAAKATRKCPHCGREID